MDCIDFDAARAERRQQTEPLTFRLGGETFTVRAIGLGDIWLDELHGDNLPAAPERFAPTTPGGRQLLETARVVAHRIVVEDRERWWSIFDEERDPIDAADLYDVVDGLTKAMVARPTSPSGGSAAGRNGKTNGTPSNSEPDGTSEPTSSKSARGKGSAGSNGSPTKRSRKKATATSRTGSRGATRS